MDQRQIELRRRLNETQKSTIKCGLNGQLKNAYPTGNYIICIRKEVKIEYLQCEQVWHYYQQGARFKYVSEEFVRDVYTMTSVTMTEYKTILAEVKEQKATEKEKLKKEKSKNKKWEGEEKKYKVGKRKDGEDREISKQQKLACEAAATVGASLLGIYTELGAKVQYGLKIKGKSWEFEPKIVADLKASVNAGWLGVFAKASAEANVGTQVSKTVKEFKTESGTEIKVKVNFAVKLFAKAEAYAGLGLNYTGAYAFAGVGAEGKIGAEIHRKRKDKDKDFVNAGGASVALAIKWGKVAGLSIGTDIRPVVENGKVYLTIEQKFQVAEWLSGVDLKINAKILEDIFYEAKDKVLKRIKDIIVEEKLALLENKAKEIKEKLGQGVRDCADKVKRGWETTKKYGHKLVDTIEEGLDHHKAAMGDHVKRQVSRLKKYKQELGRVVDKFDNWAEQGKDKLSRIGDEISDSSLKERIAGWFGRGDKANHKELKKSLSMNLQQYDQQIARMNQFLDQSYTQTLAKVRHSLRELNGMIGSFKSKDIPSNFTSSAAYQQMVSKIQEIQTIIGSIDRIIGEKQKLLKQVKTERELRYLIGEMGRQATQIKNDFYQLYQILKNYVHNLPNAR